MKLFVLFSEIYRLWGLCSTCFYFNVEHAHYGHTRTHSRPNWPGIEHTHSWCSSHQIVSSTRFFSRFLNLYWTETLGLAVSSHSACLPSTRRPSVGLSWQRASIPVRICSLVNAGFVGFTHVCNVSDQVLISMGPCPQRPWGTTLTKSTLLVYFHYLC